ncbi:MAG: helix-turn-helix transcriptional regulator [Ruminococcaceae bacterium]|nr:helix-turn-helix transcriptional regulator [Oscillospiraceae bacterium]
MKREWNEAVITKVALAVYVEPNAGKHIHKNRLFHGFVLNEENSIKDYCFSDGRVMRTGGGDLFYLPKHSSYYVKTIERGGCYAINFDAEMDDEPFTVKLRNTDALQKSFKAACGEWRSRNPACGAAAMRALYDAIYHLQKEQERDYMPGDRESLIAPAVEAIERDFTDCGLTVARLAAICAMSEVYFRKIFMHRFGVSPKEYLIRKRMEYAKQLIASGQLALSDIAVLCGYGEPCHFSREFKKRFGVSPNHYQ